MSDGWLAVAGGSIITPMMSSRIVVQVAFVENVHAKGMGLPEHRIISVENKFPGSQRQCFFGFLECAGKAKRDGALVPAEQLVYSTRRSAGRKAVSRFALPPHSIRAG